MSLITLPAPDPEVAATAKRRQFSSREKRRILAAGDRCSEAGEIGALLRREGIYSSQLATWRKQRAAAERVALAPQKRGRKADPTIAEARRVAELTQENERLRRKLAPAHTIIDVQKKLCTLLDQLRHYGACPQAKVQTILARVATVDPAQHPLLLRRREAARPPGRRRRVQCLDAHTRRSATRR